jgi:hypothetical protein
MKRSFSPLSDDQEHRIGWYECGTLGEQDVAHQHASSAARSTVTQFVSLGASVEQGTRTGDRTVTARAGCAPAIVRHDAGSPDTPSVPECLRRRGGASLAGPQPEANTAVADPMLRIAHPGKGTLTVSRRR